MSCLCGNAATHIGRDAQSYTAVLCCSIECGRAELDTLLIGVDPKRARDDTSDAEARKTQRPAYRSPLVDYTRRDLPQLIERYAVHQTWAAQSDVFVHWLLASMADPQSLWALPPESFCAVAPAPGEETERAFGAALLEYDFGEPSDMVKPRRSSERIYVEVPEGEIRIIVTRNQQRGNWSVQPYDEPRARVLWNRAATRGICRFIAMQVHFAFEAGGHFSALLWDRLDGTMMFVEPHSAPLESYEEFWQFTAVLDELQRFSLRLRGVRSFVPMQAVIDGFGGPQLWATRDPRVNLRLCEAAEGFCVSATLLWIDALVRNARPLVPLREDASEITRDLRREVLSWPAPPGGADSLLLGYHSVLVDRFARTLRRYEPLLADAMQRQPEYDIDVPEERDEVLQLATDLAVGSRREMQRVLTRASVV